MPLYRYVKKEKSKYRIFLHRNRQKFVKLFPAAFLALGSMLLFVSLGQILFWQFKFANRLDSQQLVRPIPNTARAFDPGSETQTTQIEDKDLIKASNWFPEAQPQQVSTLKVSSYTVSIPKLNIKDALVIIGSEDLDKSLIHYGGTGLPGEFGNGVVFGHSVLPQFFNPKNYKTIFSTLPTLKEGDEVFVNYDSVLYKYVVIGMRVVDPTDISVLEQRYDDSYLSFITCVPPGTYWKRLVVQTKIVNLH